LEGWWMRRWSSSRTSWTTRTRRMQHIRGVRQPNATALSCRSLWGSASTASCTTTSPLSVAPRPSAYAAGVPAIGPGRASVLVRRRASEALRRRASLHPWWRVAPGNVALMVRGDPACRRIVAP
jgi:hypothetical protein